MQGNSRRRIRHALLAVGFGRVVLTLLVTFVLLATGFAMLSSVTIRKTDGTAMPQTAALSLPPLSPPAASLRSFANCTVSSPGPGAVAYNAADNETYVTDGASVAVLNQTCNVVTYVSLPSGGFSQDIAYNPANREIYVADGTLGQVDVINGTTIVHTITGIPHAYGTTYDGALGGMAVRAGTFLYMIVDKNVTLTISHLPSGWAVSYSPLNGGTVLLPFRTSVCYLYHCYTTFKVAVLNATTGSLLRKITINTTGGFAGYDPNDRLTYMCTGTVLAALNVSSGTVVGSLSLGYGCSNVVYSSVRRAMYVLSGTTNQVDVVRNLTLVHHFRISGAAGVYEAGYNSATASLYLTSLSTLTIYVVPT